MFVKDSFTASKRAIPEIKKYHLCIPISNPFEHCTTLFSKLQLPLQSCKWPAL